MVAVWAIWRLLAALNRQSEACSNRRATAKTRATASPTSPCTPSRQHVKSSMQTRLLTACSA
eukprot:8469957-Lingulodinium_polyedra.AAC.1